MGGLATALLIHFPDVQGSQHQVCYLRQKLLICFPWKHIHIFHNLFTVSPNLYVQKSYVQMYVE